MALIAWQRLGPTPAGARRFSKLQTLSVEQLPHHSAASEKISYLIQSGEFW
jgi:hypothetical protein